MATLIAGSYDAWLVALSFAIALVTSYTALDLAGRVTANHGIHRVMWLLGGAFAMGSGIWCMHCTGMLALRQPTPVYYHLPTMLLSLLASVVASYIALLVVSRNRMTTQYLLAGSVLMGAAIAIMHYTGMASIRLVARHYYNLSLWLLSIGVAVVVSFAALLIIYHSGGEKHTWQHKAGAALALGIAIPAMDYTGMAAVRFAAVATPPNLSYSADISALAHVAIPGITFLVLGFALDHLSRRSKAERAAIGARSRAGDAASSSR